MRSGRLLGQGAGHARMLARAREGRLPHGVLICGGRGLGKTTAALELAAVLLDDDPRVWTGAHPDLHLVEVPEDKEDIPVDRVRELRDALLHRPVGGGARVAILDPADRLNEQGQNALLKTLEEPGRHSYLLLATRRPEALLPTVRSRLATLRLRPLSAAAVASALAGGAGDHVAWAAAVAGGSLGVARELLAEAAVLQPIHRQLGDFVADPAGTVPRARAMLEGVAGRPATVRRAQLVLLLLRHITRSCAFSPTPPQGLGRTSKAGGELHSTLAAGELGTYPPEASVAWSRVFDRLFTAEEDLVLRLAPEPVLAGTLVDLAGLLASPHPSHP